MDTLDIQRQLLNEGWQSWSDTEEDNLVRFPLYEFAPADVVPMDITLPDSLRKPARGWCSWYGFADNISSIRILEEANTIRRLKLPGIDYILIDDGWQQAWGDWLKTNERGFPEGIRKFAQKIREMNFKTGIWYAPFLASPTSDVFKKHPNWIVRDERGNFIEGVKLTAFDRLMPYQKYILDITNPEVRAYIYRCIDFLLAECKFDLIKLDFLYSTYYNHQLRMSEADLVLREIFNYIRLTYPNVYLSACGSPLFPAAGAVDSMRVSSDLYGPQLQNLRVISRFINQSMYRQVIRSVRARMWTKQLWNIDPDVFACSNRLGYTDQQIQDLSQLIKDAEGNVFLGDALSKLSAERIERYILPLLES